jgi:hypothetical protein
MPVHGSFLDVNQFPIRLLHSGDWITPRFFCPLDEKSLEAWYLGILRADLAHSLLEECPNIGLSWECFDFLSSCFVLEFDSLLAFFQQFCSEKFLWVPYLMIRWTDLPDSLGGEYLYILFIEE